MFCSLIAAAAAIVVSAAGASTESATDVHPSELAAVAPGSAVQDSVLRLLWVIAMDSSRVYPLAQTLLDSIGPRLTGTPEASAALDWLLARYRDWKVPAHLHRYGVWQGWSRGAHRSHRPAGAYPRGNATAMEPRDWRNEGRRRRGAPAAGRRGRGGARSMAGGRAREVCADLAAASHLPSQG